MSTAYTYNYEQRTVNNTTTCYHYVASPDGLVAVYVKSGSTSTPYYVETDHLGSICRAYDASGNLKFSATYDPWGKQTVSTKTLDLRRGYTGHEHWNEFGLIDMNGRFYDPVVGRFLSPDPYVQDPSNPQNFNRYSYCLNNPLKYTDPCGKKRVPAYRTEGIIYKGNCERNREGSDGCGGGSSYIASECAVPGSGSHKGNNGWLGSESTCNFNDPYSDVYNGSGSQASSAEPQQSSSLTLEDFEEYADMIFASDLDGGTILNTVNVIAYDQDSYDKAAQNIAEQIWGGTGSSAYSASSALSNSLGRAISAAGVTNTAISNELSTNSKYAHRVNGTPRTPQVLNRAKNIKYNSAIKATGALGKVLPAISLALSFKDGYINGWQPHHFADMGLTAAFAIGSCFCPVIALVGVAYAATDLTISLATDKSITERLD